MFFQAIVLTYRVKSYSLIFMGFMLSMQRSLLKGLSFKEMAEIRNTKEKLLGNKHQQYIKNQTCQEDMNLQLGFLKTCLFSEQPFYCSNTLVKTMHFQCKALADTHL